MVSAWHGCVVIVGAGDVKVSIDTDLYLKKELVVRGNLVCSMSQYHQAVDFLQAHPAVRLDDMITHRFKITEAAEALLSVEAEARILKGIARRRRFFGRGCCCRRTGRRPSGVPPRCSRARDKRQRRLSCGCTSNLFEW